ncbi:MAG TPA: cytochrome c maturation protein CcmE [Gaiellaceae bacterium]|nr:cytochrome c maturation protein CcmE [Gaiellaceae bacterium]
MSGSPARLVIALSVAATLALFLLYTSLAGGATRSLQPGELRAGLGTVNLAGLVLGPVRGDADAAGMRFRLRDIAGTASVPVVYRGSVPDLFKTGRHVFVRGSLRRGVFVATPGSLMTKCPSRYVTKGG